MVKVVQHSLPSYLAQMVRSVSALVLREMSTTYGRSPGGYVWAVLEPVLGTALLTFVFSLAFSSPPLGTSFALFYATGLLPFLMYTDLVTKVMQSIQFSRQLLFYPRVTFLDAIVARFVLALVTNISVMAILFVGIIQLFGLNLILDLPAILSSAAMAASLGLGFGILNCFLMSSFQIWIRVWAILNRPMFIISCIFFLPENLPETYRDILYYNPLVHIVGEMRTGFYPGYEGSYVSHLYVYGFSAVCALLGMALLVKYNRHILNN